MASEKMTSLIMSGPIGQLEDVVRQFVVERSFHPENAVPFLSQLHHLDPIQPEDNYTPLLTRADALLNKLGLSPYKTDFPPNCTMAAAEGFISSLEQEIDDLEQQGRALKDDNVDLTDPILCALRNVPVSVLDMQRLHYAHALVGRMRPAKWEELLSIMKVRPDELVLNVDEDDSGVYVVALALDEGMDRLYGELTRLGFERFYPTHFDTPDLTAAEMFQQAEEERKATQQQREEIGRRLAAIPGEKGDELLSYRAWLAFSVACVQAESYAGQSVGKFYLTGWVPSEEAESFRSEFENNPGCACTKADASELKGAHPPVKMKTGRVVNLLTPLMDMYGMPAYGTADPRIFMVITYVLFFGIMFGDAGQGACLAVLGFLLYKRNKNWLWRIIGVCGCCSVVFGLFYGSVFGLEELLPWGGYHPLESDHIMNVLIAGAAVGVVVIIICMIFNMINSFRSGDIKNAVFSPNGVAGAVLYIAVILLLVPLFVDGFPSLAKVWFIVPFIVLPVLLLWFADPLSKLCQGRKDWKPDGWGMYITQGFFELFESAISYMSNTMSFLRLGAFAISHAGMMMVVRMLCQNMAMTGTIITMVIGNAFVAALEAALSSIQIIRLEFYEIFGRFYVSGGQEFKPVTVNYTK